MGTTATEVQYGLTKTQLFANFYNSASVIVHVIDETKSALGFLRGLRGLCGAKIHAKFSGVDPKQLICGRCRPI